MKIKKGTINIDGKEVEQFFIETKKDINTFFKRFPQMKITALKDSFNRVVSGGEVVITDTYENGAGFYSWRTEGKTNWNRVTELELV